MDWTTIITALISTLCGGGILSLMTLKSDKKKAETEVKSSDNKEQAERIDLGDKYVNQMLSMLEKITDVSEKNKTINEDVYNSNSDAFGKINDKIDVIHEEVVSVKSEVSSIVSYLNGPYKSYKTEHAKDKK